MYLLEDRKRPKKFLRYFLLRDWHANNLTIEVFVCMHTSFPVVCMCACARVWAGTQMERSGETLGVLAFPLVLTRVLVYLCLVSISLEG